MFRHFSRHLRNVAEFQNGASLDHAKDALFEFASDPIGPVRGPAIGVSFVDIVGDFQNIVRDGIVHGRIDPFGQTDTGLIKRSTVRLVDRFQLHRRTQPTHSRLHLESILTQTRRIVRNESFSHPSLVVVVVVVGGGSHSRRR